MNERKRHHRGMVTAGVLAACAALVAGALYAYASAAITAHLQSSEPGES